MAAVTICSDFGAQKSNVCHCFHCFPIFLPWNTHIRKVMVEYTYSSIHKHTYTHIFTGNLHIYTQKHSSMKNLLPSMNNEFRYFPKWKWLRLFSFNYVRVIKDQMSIFLNCWKLRQFNQKRSDVSWQFKI